MGDTRHVGHQHRDEVVLVTDAARSRVEERDERVRRYLWSMGVRTLCFILAVTLLHGWEQWVAIAASLVLPWVAVIVANAGPVRPQRQQPAFFVPTPERAISSDDDERRTANRP